MPSEQSISVVIPTYEREDLLRDALASVLAQSWQPQEIIVVDDGSPSGPPVEVVSMDRRIKLITQPNLKRGAARMRGIRESKSQFVALLDDDDIWEKEHLSSFQGALSTHPTGEVFFSGVQRWRPATGRRSPMEAPTWAWKDLPSATLFATWVPIIGLIATKEALLKCGGFPEDPDLDGSEDFIFVARLCAYTEILRFGSMTALMRDHPRRGMTRTDHIIESRRRARSLLIREGRLGEQLSSADLQLLDAGTHRLCAALYYEDGDMRAARAELKGLVKAVGLRRMATLGGRLWLQTLMGKRGSLIARRLRSTFSER